MERKKSGERSGERERKGSERERDEESMRERDRWGSEWVRERGRLLKRERERGRDSPFSLSASFPTFLSFHLRLFNLFYDHSPSPLSPPFNP